MHAVASEARTIEGRLSKSDWIVGDSFSAVDMVIFPGIQLLRRALERPQAAALSSRFMPVEVNYPALGRWLARVAACPATSAPIRRTGELTPRAARSTAYAQPR